MSGPLPRPGILEIAAYQGGESSIEGQEHAIKLSSNESAFGPSPKAVQAFTEAARAMHRYPDGHATALREALGRVHGLDAERIVCGAGSDEFFSLLCRAYAGPGDEVLYSRHGFLIFAIAAHAAGADPVAVAEKNLTADVDAILDRVGPKTRLVFLANPNNPTGSYLSAKTLARLHAELPGDVLLVIDAAYAEFATADDYSAGAELVEAAENVVMTRTFSKIFGLGGARLGWAYCPPAVADVLNRTRAPFNVSSPAMAAGLAALADTDFVEKARAHNAIWRAWTRNRLLELGLDVPPSQGNFVLARFPAGDGHDAGAADAFLKSKGVIVRRVVAYGLPDSLRITIGLEDEMTAVVDALSEFMG